MGQPTDMSWFDGELKAAAEHFTVRRRRAMRVVGVLGYSAFAVLTFAFFAYSPFGIGTNILISTITCFIHLQALAETYDRVNAHYTREVLAAFDLITRQQLKRMGH